jgi:hypothetical protein
MKRYAIQYRVHLENLQAFERLAALFNLDKNTFLDFVLTLFRNNKMLYADLTTEYQSRLMVPITSQNTKSKVGKSFSLSVDNSNYLLNLAHSYSISAGLCLNIIIILVLAKPEVLGDELKRFLSIHADEIFTPKVKSQKNPPKK